MLRLLFTKHQQVSWVCFKRFRHADKYPNTWIRLTRFKTCDGGVGDFRCLGKLPGGQAFCFAQFLQVFAKSS